jgi:hypothetical protein
LKILTLAGKPDTQILELPGYWLVAAIGASLLVVLLLMAGVQVEIDPANGVDRLFAVVAGTALLARFALRPGSSNAQRIARDAIDHIGLFALVCLVGALASYPLAAHTSGFDDVALERADRLMHFDWLAWYAFVAAHPLLQLGESIAYQTIFVTPVILLGYFAVSGRRAEARMLIAGATPYTTVRLLGVREVRHGYVEVDDVTVTMTVLDPDDERSAARVRGDDETPLRARLAEVEALLSR